MNFVFGLAIASGTTLFLWILFRLIPNEVIGLAPEKYTKFRPIVERFLLLLVFLIIFATNFATYGPRNSLPPGSHSPTIERVPVDSGEGWSTTRDRFGEADERLNREPVRADELTPAEPPD